MKLAHQKMETGNWMVFVLATLFCTQRTAQTRFVFINTFSTILRSLKRIVSILIENYFPL